MVVVSAKERRESWGKEKAGGWRWLPYSTLGIYSRCILPGVGEPLSRIDATTPLSGHHQNKSRHASEGFWRNSGGSIDGGGLHSSTDSQFFFVCRRYCSPQVCGDKVRQFSTHPKVSSVHCKAN